MNKAFLGVGCMNDGEDWQRKDIEIYRKWSIGRTGIDKVSVGSLGLQVKMPKNIFLAKT